MPSPVAPKPDRLEVERLGTMTVVTPLDRSLMDPESVRNIGKHLLAKAQSQGANKQQFLLNLANVELVSSAALSELISLYNEMVAGGHELLLCNVHPSLMEIFHIMGLDRLLQIQAEPAFPGQAARARSATEGVTNNGHGHNADGIQLVIGDHQVARAQRIKRELPADLKVHVCTAFEDLVTYCRKSAPAAVLLPLEWPASQAAGAEPDQRVLSFLRAFGSQTTVFIYASVNRLSIDTYSMALAAGAKQILNEESTAFGEELGHVITRLVQNYHAAQREREELVDLFAGHGVIGESPSMREVFRRALKASQFHDLPVLIQGETGTGKQRLAEAIHHLDSKRSSKPFLTLNCSAINKTLAESELFGHTKGAFSGADSDRPGIFRMANGGTLLLDEIGDLALELQPKLLRVLQEQRLLPVGDNFERSVDVRIIAATNRPLLKMVEEGRFRDDLYQRLNVFQIYIPPLRERPLCIEAQARHFLKIHQIGRERKVTDFGLRVLEALRLMPWEGNSRQLENFIRESLAHKEHGTLLQMEDLPHWVLETLARLRPRAPEVDSKEALVQKVYEGKMTWSEAMQEFERRLLQVVLERNQGNRTKTAAELGLTPRSILNKIKKYKLD